MKTPKLLDCTIRDGGYMNNWAFEKKVVRETYRALSKAGIDYAELGYWGTEKYFDKKKYGMWRFSQPEDLQEAVEGVHGCKIAIMVDHGKCDLESIPESSAWPVAMIRVAAHKNKIRDAIHFTEQIKRKGYEVTVNAMGVTSYTREERVELAKMFSDSPVDYLYIADSYGSLLPSDLRKIFEPLKEAGNLKLGFHPHNNLQMAFANSLEVMKLGLDIIDGTIYGMGRAAGNLAMETMVAFLEPKAPDKYNAVPLLNLIDRYYARFQEETPWGYQLPYMLSGIFKCHPDYASNLVERHEYAIEDIRKILEEVQHEAPIGYDKTLLQRIIRRGVYAPLGKSTTNTTVFETKTVNTTVRPSYVDRHAGKDFLILASGPSLKEHAAALNQFIARHQPIVMGGNNLGGIIKPDYHAFNNKRRFASYVDTVDSQAHLLLGQYLDDDFVREYTKREYEKISYIDDSSADFGIQDGVIQSNCRTIATLLIGVAIVMGAKRVFVAGMDGYLSPSKSPGNFYFYDERDDSDNYDYILERHNSNLKYLEQIDSYLEKSSKDGIHILTPTSYKRFYTGIANYL